MEGTGLRRRWNKRAAVSTVLLLVCMFISAVAEECGSDEFLSVDGICCNVCLPGFKLLKACQSKTQRSNCTKCLAGQYMDKPNYSNTCRSCQKCKPDRAEIQLSPCESYRNTICGCKEGYYKDIIDSKTFQCIKCKECKQEEREKHKCLPMSNTVCECKDKYYKVKGKCQLCRNCTAECRDLCAEGSTSPVPEVESHFLINVIAGVAVGAVVLVGLIVIITHVVTKEQTKKKLLKSSSQSSDASSQFCKEALVNIEESSSSSVEAVPSHDIFMERETSNLPDCVPLEISTSELIYTVLDVVPVAMVKRLVRSLNVTDKEIEWTEMDHRSCREAHYQMLRVWAERGSRAGGGGRGGMLHQPLLQELLDKLRLMHLGQAAEELETKYSIQ